MEPMGRAVIGCYKVLVFALAGLGVQAYRKLKWATKKPLKILKSPARTLIRTKAPKPLFGFL